MATFWSLVTDRATASPDALMLGDEHGRTLTFAQFRDTAEQAAAGLFGWGVRPGSRVVWQLSTRLETLVLTAALCRIGAVQVPVLPIYRGRELAFVLAQTQAEHVVVARTWRDIDLAGLAADAVSEGASRLLVVDDALPTADPGTLPPPPASDKEVRWIFYTSGTTSEPKGAMHSDTAGAAAARVLIDGLGIVAGDRIAMVFPIAHIGGCAVWQAASLLSGAALIFTEYVDPATINEFVRDQRITIAGTGPAHHAMYLAAQRAHPGTLYFPDVRIYTSGGAAKAPSHYAMIMSELGKSTLSSYGLTEAPIVTCTHTDDPESVLARSEGRAGAGVTLRIVGTDDAVQPTGVSGEVRVKAPQVMRGYLDSSLDADAFDADGFLHTGDLGSLDEDGNLTITGRIKDVIIRKGETFSAREVEDLLITSPEVADVTVIGLPHPVLGELACACVVAADSTQPPTLASLSAHLAGQHVMKQKWPERLELMDALPYNLAGKVIKADLRTLFS